VEDGAGKYNHMQAFQHLCNLKEGLSGGSRSCKRKIEEVIAL